MSEVSFEECCADSPYPFIKDPNLVSSKLVKKYLQEGGNIDNEVNNFYANLIPIGLILCFILLLVFKYFEKKEHYENFKNKKNNNLINKVKSKKKPTIMKKNKKDFKPINSK